MRIIFANLAIAIAMIASPAFAQLELEVECPAKVDEYRLCVVQITSNAKFVNLRVRANLFTAIDAVRLAEPGRWAFTAPPGRYLVEVLAYDPELGVDSHESAVDIVRVSPPDPDPNPDPDPSPVPDEVPADEFDNLARSVATWAREYRLEKTREVAAVYTAASARLAGRADPILLTLDAASEYIKSENVKLNLDRDQWQRWGERVAAQWRVHVKTRGDAVRFYELVAIGLGGA